VSVRDDILAIDSARLRNAKIAADYLVFMDFMDAPMRTWTGWGDLQVGAVTYQGTGDLISVPAFPLSTGASADQATFKLQGVTQEMMALARAAKSRVEGRAIKVFLQLFDVEPQDSGVQRWAPLMPPFSIYTGKMGQMSFSAVMGENGTAMRTIDLSSYGLFSKRNSPANGRWNEADTRRRYPSDGGAGRMQLYTSGYSPIWRP
jgi:hypothetical protein